MDIQLIISECRKRRVPMRVYDPERDDTRSILIDMTDNLSDGCELKVSGFGETVWRTVPEIDLCLVLEQLPEILSALTRRESFNLDFYEQHLQRYIEFRAEGDAYIGVLTSYLDELVGAKERLGQEELLRMFQALRDEFVAYCERNDVPERLRPWFQEWLRQVCIIYD